jgi:hypothetical protein
MYDPYDFQCPENAGNMLLTYGVCSPTTIGRAACSASHKNQSPGPARSVEARLGEPYDYGRCSHFENRRLTEANMACTRRTVGRLFKGLGRPCRMHILGILRSTKPPLYSERRFAGKCRSRDIRLALGRDAP